MKRPKLNGLQPSGIEQKWWVNIKFAENYRRTRGESELSEKTEYVVKSINKSHMDWKKSLSLLLLITHKHFRRKKS
jgi:hypothetical protein